MLRQGLLLSSLVAAVMATKREAQSTFTECNVCGRLGETNRFRNFQLDVNSCLTLSGGNTDLCEFLDLFDNDPCEDIVESDLFFPADCQVVIALARDQCCSISAPTPRPSPRPTIAPPPDFFTPIAGGGDGEEEDSESRDPIFGDGSRDPIIGDGSRDPIFDGSRDPIIGSGSRDPIFDGSGDFGDAQEGLVENLGRLFRIIFDAILF